ncbi:hypothetical protein [Fimbriiglobus ruber]|uniref:Uncharacterized protein n=1 Tax=Fimbriiglobus ruber TaxID=1908690 RepID=A0A225E737_9BACT|nr:hypothetical protein [Fimbriiglobus ruber]OWK46608.1 hypothetical protein FRUB_00307 [Fimbriiglobus ruber]
MTEVEVEAWVREIIRTVSPHGTFRDEYGFIWGKFLLPDGERVLARLDRTKTRSRWRAEGF